MSVYYVLGLVLTVAAAVRAILRGQAWPWLLVICMLGPIGAGAYLAFDWFGGKGEIRFRKRRTTAADEERARADVVRLDNAAAWSDYASVLRGRGKHALAVEAAEKALARDPADLCARYEMGRSLFDLERYAEASRHLDAVVARDKGHDYGEAALALAKAHRATGDHARARVAFEELATMTARPEVLYHLAEYEAKAGDTQAAAATLRRLRDEAAVAPAFARRQAGPWVRRARRALRSLGVPP